jgi:inorganic pyrophosphatase
LSGCLAVLGVAACVSACAASGVQPAAPAAEGAEARAPDALAEQRLCDELPPHAWRQLQSSLEASRRHARHVWRDLPPFAADGTLNGYVEIPLGESRKWEFDIAANELRLDRTLDASLGGYPINYGFVPQTVSCDGDPFDVLVLGPKLAAGNLVTGQIVGVMYMEDEKGPDGKVIMAPSGEEDALTPELQAKLQRWFDAYKKGSTDGRWSRADGFGSAAEGRALVQRTHRFYEEGKGQ